MAKYIKFNLTAPNAATGSELLINIDQISRIATVSTLTTDIFYGRGGDAVTQKWTVTHLAPLVASAVLDSIQAAMTANPGGVISTVGTPASIAQAPLPQTGSGRQPITIKAVAASYTSAAFTA